MINEAFSKSVFFLDKEGVFLLAFSSNGFSKHFLF